MFALATKPEGNRLHGMECKVASCLDEWRDAFSLVYQSYRRAGLSEPRACRLRVTPYHLLPTTSVLIARFNSNVVGTLTLIRDSSDGVPMECAYDNEIKQARAAGVAFAEVSCLATEQLPAREYLYVFVRLMRLVAQHSRYLGTERLVIVTHPRHVVFYERLMGFQRWGGTTSYSDVCGAPAVAAYMDFAEADRKHPPFYDDCFGTRIQEEALRPHPMPDDVASYFQPFTAPLEKSEYMGESFEFRKSPRAAVVEASRA